MKNRLRIPLIIVIGTLLQGCSWHRSLNSLLSAEKKVASADATLAKNGEAIGVAKEAQLEEVRKNNSAIRRSLEAPNLDEANPYWSWCHIAYQLSESNESALGAPRNPLDVAAIHAALASGDRLKADKALTGQAGVTQAATAKLDALEAKGRDLQGKLDQAEKKQHETESVLAKAQAGLRDAWLSIKMTGLGLLLLLLGYVGFRVYLAFNPATAGVSLGLGAARGAVKELVSGIESIKEMVFASPALENSPEDKANLELKIKNILLQNSTATSDAADKLTKSKIA